MNKKLMDFVTRRVEEFKIGGKKSTSNIKEVHATKKEIGLV